MHGRQYIYIYIYKESMYIRGIDNLEIAGYVPSETRDFALFPPNVQPGFGAHQCHSLWVHGAGERVRRPGCET